MLEKQKQYLLNELMVEKSSLFDLQKKAKDSEARLNQILGALDTLSIIESEQKQENNTNV